jgi:3-dehydroquinate dehydratase-1
VELVNVLQIGRIPRVVGTIITADYLLEWSAHPQPLPCDLVEFRLDGFPQFEDWLRIATQIEHQGKPVIVTLRLQKEGGLWTGGDLERWEFLEPAIRRLSGVDVELRSDLASAVSVLCRQLGKLGIFSFHDFTSTPPREELEAILSSAERLGAVGKIAATAHSPADVEQLRALLRRQWKVPVCVIGMGPLGRETRLQFPLEGSCFAYGYLDTPGAPGQYSAAELSAHFSARTGCD